LHNRYKYGYFSQAFLFSAIVPTKSVIMLLYSALLGTLAAVAIAAKVNVFLQTYDGSLAYTIGNGSSVYYTPSAQSAAPLGVYDVKSNESLIPFTVVVVEEGVITKEILQAQLEEYAKDDVWTEAFLGGIQIISTAPSASLDASGLAFLQSLTSTLLIEATISCSSSEYTTFSKSSAAPPGPYLAKVSNGKLEIRKTYATFYDQYDSFMNGVTADDDSGYSYVRVWHPEQFEKIIPYPSRLYSSLLDPAVYPLAGVRFAIKDIVDLKGTITGGGSREYARLYNTPKNATAPAIQKLIDMGAVPLGKTKTATFAWGAWPDQNDDIPYPWNPRADGYLGLSASSHGSASAIAAYGQLDFVIGTDTGGSVRNPADRAGVYGLRPTWSVVDVTGVIESAETLDAVGFLTRDPLLGT
jgi:hypothetical protein